MKAWRAACAAAVVFASLGIASAPASAAEVKEVSWWWRGNSGPAPVPPPPTVPPGGILVAGAPDGATAIAAVHYVLAEGEANPTLTLAVAENGDQGGAQAVMAACLAGSAWGGSEQGGPWESKPNVACQAGSVQGVRAADGKTVTFGLGPLVVGREVNVVITPGTVAPGAPVGSTFSLAFAPPTSASLTTTPGGASASPDAGPAPLSTPISVAESSLPTTDLGSPATGLDAIAPLSTPSAFQPALPESSQGLTATAPLVQQATAGNVPKVADGGRGSAAAVLVMLGCLVVAVRLYRMPTPGPRLLGPLASLAPQAAAVAVAAPAPGGLGRFTKPRSGAPPPLI